MDFCDGIKSLDEVHWSFERSY